MPHHEPPAAAADQPLRTIAILATMMAFRTGTTLAALAAAGTLQCEGEAKVEISAGDVIWCPPGHKHRHGATAATSMPHIAVQEAPDGVNARPAFAALPAGATGRLSPIRAQPRRRARPR